MVSFSLVKSQMVPSHFHYTYDNNGNRVKREFIPFHLRMENDTINKYQSNLGNQKITVYPNPANEEIEVSSTRITYGVKKMSEVDVSVVGQKLDPSQVKVQMDHRAVLIPSAWTGWLPLQSFATSQLT